MFLCGIALYFPKIHGTKMHGVNIFSLIMHHRTFSYLFSFKVESELLPFLLPANFIIILDKN